MTIGHEVIGHGPTRVIVLHGWFGDHHAWAPAYPYLDREKFSYAFMDYRGYGASRAISGEYTMAEISADALALADELGWQRFGVVGHSMGGMAAQRLGIDAGERAQALVCVTPVPASGVPLPPDVDKMFASVVGDDAAGRMVIGGSLGPDAKPEMVEQILQHARKTTTAESFGKYYTAFSKTNFSSEAADLKTPMLVLIGAKDGGVSEEFVRNTFPALYPHAQLEVLPDAGHYPMIEMPRYLINRIQDFLSGRATV